MKTALITSLILSSLSGQVSAPSPAEISASVKTHEEVSISKNEGTEKKNTSNSNNDNRTSNPEKKDTTVYPVVLETAPAEKKETTTVTPVAATTATPPKNIAEAPASSTLVSANLGRGGTLAILSAAPRGGVNSLPYENEGPVSVGTALSLLVLASALGLGGFLLSRRDYLEHISQVVWQ